MFPIAFIGGIGVPEMILFFGLALLLFGGSRLPSLMRSMGQSVNEFKKGLRETDADENLESKKGDGEK